MYTIAWLINHTSITVTQKRVFNLGTEEKYLAQDKLIARFSNIGMRFFYGQNIEHGYINVLFNFVIVMRCNTSLKIK